MPAIFLLWNQKGTGTGSLLFAGMARSYIKKARLSGPFQNTMVENFSLYCPAFLPGRKHHRRTA